LEIVEKMRAVLYGSLVVVVVVVVEVFKE